MSEMIIDAKSPVVVIVPQDTAHAAGQFNGQFGSVHPPPAGGFYTAWNSTTTTPRLPPPPLSYPRHPAERFWKAFVVALVLYIALVACVRTTLVHMASGSLDGVGAPRPEDGRVLASIGHLNWTSQRPHPRWAPAFDMGVETRFTLPVGARELYLLSRGAFQSGRVQLIQSTRAGDHVEVDVRVAYADARALARATVCRLHKGGHREGVGIYTPSGGSVSSRDRLVFEVVLTFPAAPSAEVPLRIHELTVLTSNFVLEVGDVWRSMVFEKMELRTSNGKIYVESVTLTRGSLGSSNGLIVGHFNASDALSLHTSNGAIQATACLFNAGRDPTQLDMHTSNGAINASVSLTTDSGTGGEFAVTSHTSNGRIKLQYDDAPSGVRLKSEATTTNGPAMVVMHPAFQGTFEVATTNSRPSVSDTRPIDPTGAGRRRVVNKNVQRGMMWGNVYWGEEAGRGGGSCTVHTTNARASLDL